MSTVQKPVFRIIGPFDEKVVVGIDCSQEPSVTKQSFKDECDINNIMARFERTGVFDFVSEYEGRYGDASAIDYQEALNTVIEAEAMFMSMPASMRSRFENDPAKFLAFVDDPAMVNESIALGLRIAPATSDQPKADSASQAGVDKAVKAASVSSPAAS